MAYLDEIISRLRHINAIEVLPFNYSVQFLNSSVAAGTSVAGNVAIQADSDFIALYVMITVYDSPNHTVVTSLAPLTIQLTDTGSGRNLMDSAQSIQNLCGGAMNANGGSGGSAPFIFPEPLLLRQTGTLQVTITNLTSASIATGGRTFQRVDVSLSGYKVFKRRQPMPGEAWYYPN